MAWNYQNNRAKVFGMGLDVRMSYERALRNLIMFMFGYYIDAFECHGARKGHWAILALKCFMVEASWEGSTVGTSGRTFGSPGS